MKKRALSFFLVLFLLCTAQVPAFSQVPGYMGKRFLVRYDPQFMYAFLVANHFDVHHNFSLEYVTSLRHVVGFRYGFSNLKDEYEFRQTIYTSNGSEYADYLNSDVNHKVSEYTLYIKFFSKRQGYIAPAGPYAALGFCFLHSKTVAGENVSVDGEVFSEGDAFLTQNNFAVYFAKGRQFIIANRVVLNMGAQLGIPFIYYMNQGAIDELRNRVPLAYIFRVELGLGFLAF